MEKKDGLFQKLANALTKTRGGIFASIFSREDRITDDFYEELEEAMICSDMGLPVAENILDNLRKTVKENDIHNISGANDAMKKIIADIMRSETDFLQGAKSAVILLVGVNGVGKTTCAGKIAHYFVEHGLNPVLAAGDTFRAAASEQLTEWAKRADVPIVKHGEHADPSAVLFDAIASFKAKGRNILICDTAGRLHNKKNLMDELAKMRRVIGRELPDVACEVLLVLDATTGQNAIIQAKNFADASGLTGVIITKLDGTARGGMAVAIKQELGLPIRFIGTGEGLDDLQLFDADVFAEALFSK